MINYRNMFRLLTRPVVYLWRALLVLFALVVVGMSVLMLPPVQRWLGHALEASLSRQTGLPVKVGNVRYTPFATLALSGVSISDADSLPMVSLKHAMASLSLASIWRPGIIVETLEADSVMVFARVDEDGLLNLCSLAQGDTALVADTLALPEDPSAVFDVYVKRVRTKHCHVSLQRPGQPLLSADDIGVDVSQVRLDSSGFSAKIHTLAFDVPQADVRISLSSDVILCPDSLAVSSLLLSATGSTLRADSLSLVLDSASPLGVSSLRTSDIFVTVGSKIASILAGRRCPTIWAQTRLMMEDGLLSVSDLFVNFGLHTMLSAEASVWPEWPLADGHTSQLRLRDLRTCMSDVALLLDDESLAEHQDAVGLVSLYAVVNADGRSLTGELEAESSAADVAVEVSAVAFDDEWERAVISCDAEANTHLPNVFNGHLRADASSDWQWGDVQNVKFKVAADRFCVGSIPYYFGLAKVSGNWMDGFLGAQAEVVDTAVHARGVFFMEDRNTVGLSLLVDGAKLDDIGILSSRPASALSLRAGFQAVNISDPDRVECNVRVQDVDYSDARDTVRVESIVAEMTSTRDSVGHLRQISVVSDVGTANLKGRFQLSSLADEVAFQMHAPMPALWGAPASRPPKAEVKAELSLDLQSINQILHCFVPEFSTRGTLTAHGVISSDDHSAALYATVGGVEGQSDLSASDVNMALVSADGGLSAGLSVGTLNLPYFGLRKDAHLMADISDDELSLDLDWLHRDASGGQKSLAGSDRNVVFSQTVFSRDESGSLVADINVDRALVMAQDSVWRLDSCNVVARDGLIDIANLCIQSGDGKRKIECNGRVSTSEADTLTVCVRNILLDDFSPSGEAAKITFRGDLSVDAKVSSVLSDVHVASDLRIDRFWLLNEDYESFLANLDWDKEFNNIQTEVAIVTRGLPRAYGRGYVDLQKDSMLLDLKIDSLDIKFLNFYLDNCTENWHGTTSGDLALHGPLSDVQLDARLQVNKGSGMTVSVTRVPYFIDKEDSVILGPTRMTFEDIRFADSRGKTGIFSGYISHNMFSGLYTALDFDLPENMLVLKTTQKESPTYYGTVYGSGRMTVRGVTSDIKLGIKAKSGPGSEFSILPLEKGDLSGGSGRLVIRSSKDAALTDRVVEKMTSSLTADLDLDITPDAKVNVIVSEEDDNYLAVRGAGAISVALLNDGSLRMNGTYEVRNGMYYFAFQNVLSKKFNINNGGSITWDGDEPYDATLDISATYAGLKASLYDLVPAGTDLPTGDLKKRVPVDVNIYIKNKMRKPDISFGIQSRSSQNFSQHTIEQYITSEEEMNRQVYSLLLTGRFYSTQDAGNNAAGQAYLGSAASELLSNQLSNLISQNTKYVDVGVRYSPGDEVSNEEYDVALSTQMLNNRLNLSGNIGYGRDASGAASANGSGSNFIGDFDVEFKINDRGNLRAKAYTHANNDIIYETSPTTQGVGISFQEEFNSFRELWHNIWETITGRRRRRQQQE